MRSRRLEKCLRLLLAALLVGGGFSLGMRHAHPGGDRAHHRHGLMEYVLAHHHAASHDHPVCHGHAVDFDADLADDADHDREDLASASLHRHVFILGFEFTLPSSSQLPADSSEEGSQDNPSVAGKDTLFKLVSDDLPDGSAAVRSVEIASQVMPFSAPAAILVYRPSPLNGRMTPISRPLCDTARHERSGVLRI